jgi:hypothetical protein
MQRIPQLAPSSWCSMLGMRRFFLAFIAMGAGLMLVPAIAAAQELELGTTASKLVAPSCPKNVAPANCTIILTRTTALETLRDGVAYPSTVKTAGRIVAFTVGLSRLSSSTSTTKQDIHYLDSTYGGTTRVAVAVLKPVGAKNQRRWQVVAESPPVHVQPWLGKVVRFPLAKSLPVTPGETVALTTPTWAPVLSINLSSKQFAYRQSRTNGCTSPPASSAAQSVGQSTQYLCDYTGSRVEYSATEVTGTAASNSVTSSLCPNSATVTSCPVVLARTTGLETIANGVDYPTTVKSAGNLVSFTLSLSRLGGSKSTRNSEISSLNRAFGAPPEAAVTVLKPVGAKSQRRWSVVATSPVFPLTSYVGSSVELALSSSLAVKPGETIGLTTPTWAPVLFPGTSGQYAYRQSRASKCSSAPSTSAAQVKPGQSTRYLCNYSGVGVSYSANVIDAPAVPSSYVH